MLIVVIFPFEYSNHVLDFWVFIIKYRLQFPNSPCKTPFVSLNLSVFQDLKSLLVCHHGLATKQGVIFVIMQPSVTTVTRRI